MKESFLIYKEFYPAIESLSDSQLGKLFRAIFLFQREGTESVDPEIAMAFLFFKNQFRLDEVKYEARVRANQENGQKGGRPRKQLPDSDLQEEPNETEPNPKNPAGFQEPKKPYNDNDNGNDNEKEVPPLFGNEHPKDQKEILPAQGGGTEVSEEGMNFANWFAKEYPTNKPPTTRQKMNWAIIYDKLLRLDGYTKQDVIKAVKWAKNDNFWTTNFYTPVKLREKKDDVSYMERFLNGANAHKPKEEPIKHKTSGAYNPVTGQYE